MSKLLHLQPYRVLTTCPEGGGQAQGGLGKIRPGAEAEFPDTAYYLPIIYSLLGAKIEKLADAEP